MWIKSSGKLEVEHGHVRIQAETDLCFYYMYLIKKEYPFLKLGLPRYKAHCNLVNPKFDIYEHSKLDKLVEYQNSPVEFSYSIKIVPILSKKGWLIFFLYMKTDFESTLQQIIHFKRKDSKPLHFSICNSKGYMEPIGSYNPGFICFKGEVLSMRYSGKNFIAFSKRVRYSGVGNMYSEIIDSLKEQYYV